jgi:hypothetical protein
LSLVICQILNQSLPSTQISDGAWLHGECYFSPLDSHSVLSVRLKCIKAFIRHTDNFRGFGPTREIHFLTIANFRSGIRFSKSVIGDHSTIFSHWFYF